MAISLRPEPAPVEGPPVELSLVRPLERPQRRPSPPRAPRPARTAAPRETPSINLPGASLPAEPGAGTAAVAQGGGGLLDCSRETLPLLTPAEQERCRARLAAAAIGAGKAMRAGDRFAPALSAIPPEKRAYYAAVADARQKVRNYGDPRGVMDPSMMPRLSCGGAPSRGWKLGPLPCVFTPPQGVLTEDLGIPKP